MQTKKSGSKSLVKPKSSSTKTKSSAGLKPASVAAQKAWQGFPSKLKKELRKSLPDKDKDKVPDGFDCKPRNPRKQESFSSQDLEFLSSNPEIKLGKKLGSGNWGSVYTVKNNRNMVVKVPIGFTNDLSEPDDLSYCSSSRSVVRDEANMYDSYKLEREPLFIPTKVVNFGDMGNGAFFGLVRPRIKTAVDYGFERKKPEVKRITAAQIEDIRRKLIDLSYKGFAIEDGLQIGFDRSGRALLYDFGGMTKYTISNSTDQRFVFESNQKVWQEFLHDIGKIKASTPSEYEKAYRKYGRIEPR